MPNYISSPVSSLLDATNTWASPQVFTSTITHNDNTLLRLGTDGDFVLKLTSAVVAADAEPDANVYVGTSDHQGTAANSIVLSNVTLNGDLQGLVNNGGNSLEWLLVDASALDITLGFGGLSTSFPASGLRLWDSNTSHRYTIVPANLTADRNLTLPLITGTDTLAVLGLAQSFSAIQTFSVGFDVLNGVNGDLVTRQSGAFARLAPGTEGQVVTSVSGIWAAANPPAGTVPNSGVVAGKLIMSDGANGYAVDQNAIFTGTINHQNTTDATSPTAAALKTAGGLAVAKKVYTGEDIFFGGGGQLETVTGTLAAAGTLDLTTNALSGQSWLGFLAVANVRTAAATVRTITVYAVLCRGTDVVFTSLATDNGPGGASAFSLSAPSNGVIRLTNNDSVETSARMVWLGAAGG